jgi:hypothetical protein
MGQQGATLQLIVRQFATLLLLDFIGGVPVFHRSTKQKTVSTSAMQAEVAALFESIPCITWFRDLDELGRSGQTKVEQDNQSALTHCMMVLVSLTIGRLDIIRTRSNFFAFLWYP